MTNITRRIIIGSALFVALWTTQTALAWYDPSTGRWLSRDPIGEPGFQALQRVAALPQTGIPSAATAKWIDRDPVAKAGAPVSPQSRKTFSRVEELNLYCFVANNPINSIDALGLEIPKEAEDCYVAHPLYPDDPACDKYGERK